MNNQQSGSTLNWRKSLGRLVNALLMLPLPGDYIKLK